MRLALVAVVLATACNSPPADTRRPDSGYVSPCHPQSGPLCNDTCGNGVIDDCQKGSLHGEECIDYSWTREPCDGQAIACASLGYVGGTATCAQCFVDVAPCESCGPDLDLCASFGHISIAAGPATNTVAMGGFGYLDVYDVQGPTLVALAHYAIPSNNASALVAVPDGWLAISSTLDVLHVATDGTVSAPTTLTSPGFPANVVAVYGANHVGVVWRDLGGVRAAILDASGALVAGPTLAFVADVTPSVTTDGTSFFIAVHDQLAKVSVDGTVSTTTLGANPQVTSVATCAATTCWYIEDRSRAQHFDANGAATGSPITLPAGFDGFVADGTGLYALSFEQSSRVRPLELVRIDASGSVVATKTLGATDWFQNRLMHIDARVGVVFHAAFADHFAIATPP